MPGGAPSGTLGAYKEDETIMVIRYLKAATRSAKPWPAFGLALAILTLLLTAACGSGSAPSADATLLPRKTPTTLSARPPTRTPAPSHPTTALTGELDPTFGRNGTLTTDFGSSTEEAHGVVVQPDGKIVAAGIARPAPRKQQRFILTRYDALGTLDPTFGDGGTAITAITDNEYDASEAYALLLQPDGKLVAAGTAVDFTAHHKAFALARYNPDGSLDATFGDGGRVLTVATVANDNQADDEIAAIALQPDGKIVAVGKAGHFPPDFAVLRFNADGSLDPTFGDGGRVITNLDYEDEAHAVAIQPDGKILVAGLSGSQIGITSDDFALVRYNPDGSLDAAFGDGGKVITAFSREAQDWAYSMVLRPDGKVVIGGPVTVGGVLCGAYVCNTFGFGLAQYTPDGRLDPGFGAGGKVVTKFPSTAANYALLLLPDGKLVAGGHSRNNLFGLALYNPDGTLVPSFGTNGLVETDFVRTSPDRIYALALQADGKIVVAGTASTDPVDMLNSDFALARYR
jgi:uncharacterized delta-60 repeat protein